MLPLAASTCRHTVRPRRKPRAAAALPDLSDVDNCPVRPRIAEASGGRGLANRLSIPRTDPRPLVVRHVISSIS
jgi:hypothetical protein